MMKQGAQYRGYCLGVCKVSKGRWLWVNPPFVLA